MLNGAVTTDVARVLAELVDTALADNWDEDVPTMALLWETFEDPDDPIRSRPTDLATALTPPAS